MLSSSMLQTWNQGQGRQEPKDRAIFEEEQKIIETFIKKKLSGLFCHRLLWGYQGENYSLSAGQYFDIKIDYVDITAEEFEAKMTAFQDKLSDLFQQSHALEQEIEEQMKGWSSVSGLKLKNIAFQKHWYTIL